jgi:hypothetical protein
LSLERGVVTMMECFYIAMGGYWLRFHNERLESDGRALEVLLSPRLVVSLESYGIRLPYIGRESILERDKRDDLGIGLTILQIMWLVVESISRRASGLPISELELVTIAIMIAAIMNYLFWWDKS